MSNAHWWHPSVRLWNTLTNAAFPLVGLALALAIGTQAAWAYAFLLTILGVGSAVYHWWGTSATRNADWLGMVVVIVGAATFAASPADPQVHQWMLGVGLLTGASLIYGFKQTGKNPVLGIGMFLVTIPVLASGRQWVVVIGALSLLAFGAGLVLQRTDKRVGQKNHGWWHVLASLGFGGLFVAIHLMGMV